MIDGVQVRALLEGGPNRKKVWWENMERVEEVLLYQLLSRLSNRVRLVTFFYEIFVPFRDFDDEILFPIRNALASQS